MTPSMNKLWIKSKVMNKTTKESQYIPDHGEREIRISVEVIPKFVSENWHLKKYKFLEHIFRSKILKLSISYNYNTQLMSCEFEYNMKSYDNKTK